MKLDKWNNKKFSVGEIVRTKDKYEILEYLRGCKSKIVDRKDNKNNETVWRIEILEGRDKWLTHTAHTSELEKYEAK